MTRPLRVLSGSPPLLRGLCDTGLRHFFLDPGECRFVRFGSRFPYGSHIHPKVLRAISSYSSPEHHDRSGGDGRLLHYAHMTVQLRPTRVFWLDIRDERCDDAPQMIVRKPLPGSNAQSPCLETVIGQLPHDDRSGCSIRNFNTGSGLNPRSSGDRPIHFPIPPNVPPIGTRPACRARCE